MITHLHLKAIAERLLRDGRRTRALLSTRLVGRNPGLSVYCYVIPILAFNMKLGLLSFHLPPSLSLYFLHVTLIKNLLWPNSLGGTENSIIDKDPQPEV